MTQIIYDFPADSALGDGIRKNVNAQKGQYVYKSFPDQETSLQNLSDVAGQSVAINASLFHPNSWFLDLLFFADSLKSQGARKVTLIAPYLAYMRQDKIFETGQALTSKTFAHLISTYFDAMITVDPHLHRYKSLSEIYSIETKVLHASHLISEWISQNVPNPFLIGPDSESKQWVEEIAQNNPYTTLLKTRNPQGHVSIRWPVSPQIKDKIPIILDDIISSGETMIKTIELLKNISIVHPICITIHPIFANVSFEKIQSLGVQKIISCNSIPHSSNQIDLAELISQHLKVK